MAEDQDYRAIDRQHLEALRTIEKMFAGVEFSPEERRWVEEAGRRLAEFGFQLMCEQGQNPAIRPMVVMYAMAAILGGNWTFEGGHPKLDPASYGPLRSDAG